MNPAKKFKANDFCISNLPDELLLNIFSFLPTNDKLSTSLVCKKWLLWINDPKLLSDIFVKIPSEQLEYAVPFSRQFTNFLFVEEEITGKHVSFFEIFGQSIRKLIFVRCWMTKSLLEKSSKLALCKNLHTLEFYTDFINIFPELPNLKEFAFRNDFFVGFLDNLNLLELGKTMPNLEQLVFEQYLKESTQNPWKFTTLSVLYDFVKERAKTLSSLSLQVTNLPYMSTLEMFQINNLNLKILSICGTCEYPIISEICILHPTIIELHLKSLKLDDNIICSICNVLPLLTCLTLKSIPLLDSSIKEIFQLKKLHSLDISFNSGIRKESFQNAIDVFQLHNLRRLNLTSTCVDDIIMQRLIVMLPLLQELNLSLCHELSDQTLQLISSSLTFLRHLFIGGCYKITDEGILPSASDKKAISNLKNLEELSLLKCPEITANAIEGAVKFIGLCKLYADRFSSELEIKLRSQNPSLKSYRHEYQL